MMGIQSNLKIRKKSVKDKLESYRIYVPVSFIKTNNNSLKVKRIVESSRQRGRGELKNLRLKQPGEDQQNARRAHNPKAAGSNPALAIRN